MRSLPILTVILLNISLSHPYLSSKQTSRSVVQSALGLKVPPEDAERQLAIAIDWGRYAELIAYDHSADMI